LVLVERPMRLRCGINSHSHSSLFIKAACNKGQTQRRCFSRRETPATQHMSY
jgi:hypothetical protein